MELIEIGYFSKTHGIKGHLVLKQGNLFLPDADAVFVEINGSKAPYFIHEIKEAANNLVISLEDIDTVEKARAIVGKKVFVNAQYVVVKKEDLHDWVGYCVIDSNYGLLGTIEEINDNGPQQIMSINSGGREVLLPLINALIEKIDKTNKTVYYHAPEGLIEVYLGPVQ